MGCKESRFLRLLVVMVAVAMQACATQSKSTMEKHYRWQIKYEFWSPDCVERMVIAINGQFPGPTVRAKAGDTIVVEVENLMPTEGVVIHWHGIHQIGTPWADGTAGITQCAINPGETYVYKFLAEKPGTYFYHGHHGMQRTAGLYGSLIVETGENESEPFEYDEELSIIISDWWHQSVYEQMTGLSYIPFRWVGEPQSLLIQGRGRYNCSTGNCKNPQCAPHVLSVKAGKTYRLRIASVASLSSLNFLIQRHQMTIVEADGNYVEPIQVQNLDIYSGETYSVLLTADQDPSTNYWAALNVRGRPPKTPTGLAILNYLPNPSTAVPPSVPPPSPSWNDFAYSKDFSRKIVSRRGHHNYRPHSVPLKSDRSIFLLNTQNRVDGYIKWAINNVSLALPSTPYLASLKYRLGDESSPAPQNYQAIKGYDITKPPPNPNATTGTMIYNFVLNSTVDLILQNANTLIPDNSEIHPWHIHGHSFWILGYGDGLFDADKDPFSYNLRNPPLRNTVPLFPYGWTTIRLKADNPGVWAFHCHLEAHLHMGMGIVFSQGIEHVGNLPRFTMGCGSTRKLFP